MRSTESIGHMAQAYGLYAPEHEMLGKGERASDRPATTSGALAKRAKRERSEASERVTSEDAKLLHLNAPYIIPHCPTHAHTA